MKQRDVDNAIRARLGTSIPADKAVNRTPQSQINQMIEASKRASALNPNASLGGGSTPVGPEDLRAAR